MKEDLVGLAIGGVILAAIVVIVIFIVGASASVGVTKITDNRAHVEVGGRLSLSWLGKAYYDIHREGDTLVIGSLFTERHPLCGPGCTIEVPFGIFEKLVVEENTDGSLTIEWPRGYMMY